MAVCSVHARAGGGSGRSLVVVSVAAVAAAAGGDWPRGKGGVASLESDDMAYATDCVLMWRRGVRCQQHARG